MTIKSVKYIARTPVAWRCRIRFMGKVLIRRDFNFKKLGGIKKALLLAIDERDRIIKENGLSTRSRRPFQYFKPSGICIGVFRSKITKQQKTRYSWTAHIQHEGVMARQNFSVNLYGEAFAFYLACEARYKEMGELVVLKPDELLCKLDFPYKVHQ